MGMAWKHHDVNDVRWTQVECRGGRVLIFKYVCTKHGKSVSYQSCSFDHTNTHSLHQWWNTAYRRYLQSRPILCFINPPRVYLLSFKPSPIWIYYYKCKRTIKTMQIQFLHIKLYNNHYNIIDNGQWRCYQANLPASTRIVQSSMIIRQQDTSEVGRTDLVFLLL